MSRTTANLLLLLAGAVWGMGFVAQQSAMEDMPPMLFIALRFLVGTIAVSPLAIWQLRRSKSRPTIRQLQRFAILGAVFFIAMALQQVGLLTTTITNAGFLTALYVVLVPLILAVVYRQNQPLGIWIASIVSLIGVYLLGEGDIASVTVGDWLVVLCAVFWAIHVILVGKFAGDTEHPVTMAATQFGVCSILGLVGHLIGSFATGDDRDVQPVAWIDILFAALPEILYAGAFAGALAFTLQIIAQQHTSPSAAAILMGTESLFAALFAAIFMNERLPAIGYLGCALIFTSVLVVELLPRQENDTGAPSPNQSATDTQS